MDLSKHFVQIFMFLNVHKYRRTLRLTVANLIEFEYLTNKLVISSKNISLYKTTLISEQISSWS